MKFSIITACLNRREFIGAAIESVLAQNYPEFEHWIIDGGSSDGTLEVLNRYPHLKVLSEPDRGVYEAWNKGIDRASGDVVSILNSDDVYATGALHRCARIFAASPSVPVVSGGCQIFRMSRRGTAVEMHRYQNPKPLQAFIAERDRRPPDHQQPFFSAFFVRQSRPIRSGVRGCLRPRVFNQGCA